MKIAPTVSNTNSQKRFVQPIIPLERPSPKTVSKLTSLTFSLRSNPAEANSTSYSLTVEYFKTGTPEEFLIFCHSVDKVIKGQNATTGPSKFALIKRLLQGDALAAFERAEALHGSATNEHFKHCLNDLAHHVFPRRALSTQKRYMRRFLRKPRAMTAREFVTRLVEINDLLERFPPFQANQKLPDDELLDIAEFAVPPNWQKQMVLQGFNPVEHTTSEFIEFAERLEFTENEGQQSQTETKSSQNDATSRAKSSARGNQKNNNTNLNNS